MRQLSVGPNEAGQRLDKLLAKYLGQAPKSFLYKMMRKKNIVLNGKKCEGSERLKEGDEIRLFLSDETIENFSSPSRLQEPSFKEQKKKGSEPPLSIIYEDSHILLINKPSGMLSQKAKETDVSLVNRILFLSAGIRTADQGTAPYFPAIGVQPAGSEYQRIDCSWKIPCRTSDFIRSLSGSEPA